MVPKCHRFYFTMAFGCSSPDAKFRQTCHLERKRTWGSRLRPNLLIVREDLMRPWKRCRGTYSSTQISWSSCTSFSQSWLSTNELMAAASCWRRLLQERVRDDLKLFITTHCAQGLAAALFGVGGGAVILSRKAIMLHGGALPSSMSCERWWSTAFWMPEDNPLRSDRIQSSVSDRIHY